ncbi:hypothetical protein A3A40_00695 [Candidatus Kaiserbacteria bacterium RIFCSPLOWO2_01_FULL_54_20]|uniref:Uncharacterized protein n=1 Tax=Candidatus Kaiserbacteria bacterium RIFCSPLOWO2_01_FULL_54_20 TaxID=1798513 RepID=A0A1F6EJF1_9BACT|nr:MAG: hypothetical protein A3A40_00695 [Candidatus Kaiserbacteria bacterium RIFCSPLOWO2_01_FULL_54_20]
MHDSADKQSAFALCVGESNAGAVPSELARQRGGAQPEASDGEPRGAGDSPYPHTPPTPIWETSRFPNTAFGGPSSTGACDAVQYTAHRKMRGDGSVSSAWPSPRIRTK